MGSGENFGIGLGGFYGGALEFQGNGKSGRLYLIIYIRVVTEKLEADSQVFTVGQGGLQANPGNRLSDYGWCEKSNLNFRPDNIYGIPPGGGWVAFFIHFL